MDFGDLAQEPQVLMGNLAGSPGIQDLRRGFSVVVHFFLETRVSFGALNGFLLFLVALLYRIQCLHVLRVASSPFKEQKKSQNHQGTQKVQVSVVNCHFVRTELRNGDSVSFVHFVSGILLKKSFEKPKEESKNIKTGQNQQTRDKVTFLLIFWVLPFA